MSAIDRSPPLLLAALLVASVSAFAQTYTVTDLGALNGAPTYATSINDNGVISGYSLPDANSARAWIWRDGFGLTDVGSFGGVDNRAAAVGLDGKLFGYSQTGAGVQRGFVWDGVTLSDIGSLAAGDAVAAEAVNASATIVGFTTTGGNTLGFKLTSGTMTALGTLPGAELPATSAAYDINDAGQIVGVASWIGGGTRAFRTDAGGLLMSLGTLGANDSAATAINAAGEVVGSSVTAANETHAFVYDTAGVMRDLGVFTGGHDSRAYGINDGGLIIGSAEDSAANSRAFVWMPGGAIRDLNDLIPPNSGWVLKEARGINNAGDIVGYGTIGGVDHAFLVERFDGPDTFAPVAVATVTQPGQGSTVTQVAVKFWDNEKIVSATARSVGAIRISGPNNYDMPGTAFMWTTNDSQVVNVSFNVPAPGGTWDPGDNGTYEVRVAANQVSDLAGNRHPGGVIATFSVGLQTAPTFNLSSLPTTTTLGTPVSIWVSATSSYPSAVGDQFTYRIDWDGDGAVFENVVGASGIYLPHTFASLGAHVVRVRATDPHGIQSSERSMTITVSNNPVGLPGAEVLAATVSGINTYNAAASVVGSKIYFAGGPFSNRDSTIVATWNYPAGAFTVANSDLNNGPIIFAGAGTDSRGRFVVYGGGEAGAGSTTAQSIAVNASNNITTGGVAALPAAIATGVSTADNFNRLYVLSGSLYRYDASGSTTGNWASFAGPGTASPRCLSFDGGDRIIAFGSGYAWAFSILNSTWTQLPTPPVNVGRAVLGADGLVYLFAGLQVWIFDPATNTYSQVGTTTYDESYTLALKGTDGFVYLIGSYNIERLDTRTSATQPPRISSAPSVATVVQGVPWSYNIAASGKPRPTYSLVRGPAGMSVGLNSGVVTWTPLPSQVGPQTALVRASNSVGSAEQLISFNILGVAPDLTPPSVPGNVTVLPPPQLTTNSADITWTAATDNVGVTGYGIYVKRSGGTRWRRTTYYSQVATTPGLMWHFANLPLCSTSTYYLAALDAAGNRSAYAPVTIKVICVPNIASPGSGNYAGPYAIEDEPFTSVNFSAVGNPVPTLTPTGQPGGSLWHASSSSAGDFTWTPLFGQAADANYAPPVGIAQPGLATFTLKASNLATVAGGGTSGGEQTQSYMLKVWPKGTDVVPPAPVTGVVVDQVTADSAHVTWQPTTDNYGVAGYRVTAAHYAPRSRFHRGPYNDHVVTTDLPANATQTIFTGLHPSTSYTATVIARDQNGLNPSATNPTATGLWSYAWSSSGAAFTTRPLPFAVPNVAQAANPDGSLTMAWPSQGYYWLYTVQFTDSLATPNWQPVTPANQWPAYITSFTVAPEVNVPQRFYRVYATPGL